MGIVTRQPIHNVCYLAPSANVNANDLDLNVGTKMQRSVTSTPLTPHDVDKCAERAERRFRL